MKHHLRNTLQTFSLREMLQELAWIYRYARRYRRQILLYLALGLLSAALGLGSSLLSRSLTSVVLEPGSPWQQVLGLALAFVGLGLASLVLGALNSRISAQANVRIQNEMQSDLFRSVLGSDWQSLQEFHSGDLLNRLTSDVGTVSGSVFSLVPSLVIRLFQFVACLCIILYYDPVMAALSLLSAPVIVLVSRVLVRGMRSHQQEMRQVSSDLMSFQEETLQNLQPIKAFGLTGRFAQRLNQVQGEYERASLDFNRFSIFTSTFLSLVGQAVSYLCLAWGAYRLWTGYLDVATMVMFLQLAGQLSAAFSALIGLAPGAISATVAVRRILALLELPSEPELSPEAREPLERLYRQGAAHGVTLRLDHVTFQYEAQRPVLADASLVARPGEIVALLGSSGEGKTTLLRLLLGLAVPQAGEGSVEAPGAVSVPLSPATRRLFSYVPQEKAIFSGTIAQSMRLLAPEASDEAIQRALEAADAWSFVRTLPEGIHTPLGERGTGLSEGQIQRLAIARALLRDAPILLLDEATAALDVDTERRVLQNVLGSKKIRTCIVTSHRPSVFALCTRAYRIRGTRLEELTGTELEALRRSGEAWL